jgi:predicted nucleotidyltransferase/predicted transcriptional regulator with HTH domain
MNKLAPLFGSKIRAEVFRVLFGLRPERMYVSEIEKHMDFAERSVQEELEKLAELGLLENIFEKNRRYYWANKTHPLYPELRNIVLKTVGLCDVLKEALSSQKIEYAFVFGSIAALREHAESDVDLMIIGDIGLRELTPLLREPAEKIGREINAHVFSHDEWVNRLKSNDHFLRDVLGKDKLPIIGGENEFAKLGG